MTWSRYRKSDLALAFLGAWVVLLAATLVHAAVGDKGARVARDQRAALVAELGLTDLCLTTEARYTRHPSQADLHSAFQDHPLALDHFPSGSVLPPPPGLLRPHAPMD
jgi:hypothetical protein